MEKEKAPYEGIGSQGAGDWGGLRGKTVKEEAHGALRMPLEDEKNL